MTSAESSRLTRGPRTDWIDATIRPPPTTLSDDEQDRLLFVLANSPGREGRRDSAMFHLMLACGLRVGSVVALDVEDVDLSSGKSMVVHPNLRSPSTLGNCSWMSQSSLRASS